MRHGTRLGKRADGSMEICLIGQVRAAEAMTAAAFVDVAKEHLRGPIPGHLGKFINGGDQQGGQTTINLLIDYQHWKAIRRIAAAERTASKEIATVDQR